MDDAFWDEIATFRHDLHAHPELSGREVGTKQRIQDFLSSHTSLAAEDHGSWLSARFCPEGTEGVAPIAFRADMDALPMSLLDSMTRTLRTGRL